MAIEILEVNGPSYYASALINGDRSGLDDVDESDLDSWLADLEKSYPGLGSCVNCTEDSWFGVFYFHGVDRLLGCNLVEYTFHIYKD